MKFKLRIKKLDRRELLRKVVEKASPKNHQKTKSPARNEQKLSAQLLDGPGGYSQ